MLSAAAQPFSPSNLLASVYQRFISPLSGAVHSHGVVRFTKTAGRAVHVATELTFQLDNGESEESFSARVWAEAEDGDDVEFRRRDGKITAAQVTRHSTHIAIRVSQELPRA